jgi:SAM-dependent methyltransferase
MSDIEPPGTYRPQYRFRWRGAVGILNRFPWLKERLAGALRKLLSRVFEPGLITTERVIEYPFVFQNLNGIAGPILDIGCYSSREPVALASRGFRVIGLDFNAYPYKHPNLVALRADALRTPLMSGSVEAVLAVSVIEHIGIGHYGDPLDEKGDLKAVREIARVLRRGGRALITVPFGRAMRDDFQRVYDPPGLRALLAPLTVRRIEYARSLSGLWMPCAEAEAASVDWRGPSRAVAMVVATVPEEASGAHPD